MSKTIWLLTVVGFIAAGVQAAELFEDTVEKTLPLGPDGTFSLQNIDGSVEIYGSSDEQVRIVAFRRAFSPQRLNTIRIAVETTTNSVSVKTSGPPRPRWGFGDRSGTVDYVVTVPQRARVAEIDVPSGEILIDGLRGPAIAASLGSGRITIHNCFCDQDIRVKEGGVDFFFDWVEDKPITLQGALETGNMRAVIPADASFRLHAVAEKGHVVSDFTEPEKRSRHGFSEIDESVGSFPQAQVRLRVSQGNIRVSQLIW